LQRRGFGYLQNSVWITLDPVNEERALLADGPVDVESFILLEARPCAGETDAEIVAGTWDFDDINLRYRAHERVLTRRPRGRLGSRAGAMAFQRWLQEERVSWLQAVWRDPLLPASLLPPTYTGRGAWRNRVETMAEAAEQMREFQSDRMSSRQPAS